MGLQLIFVVESNSKVKSDWIYIKETIDNFYLYDTAHVKFTDIYMDGKGKYAQKDKEINKKISQYASTSPNNKSVVIYCFDCDDYNTKPEDKKFLDTVKSYCDKNNYEFVWFCKDIERVYINEKVEKSKKGIKSSMFKAKKQIKNVSSSKLSVNNYREGTSNLLCILDKFLKRKE